MIQTLKQKKLLALVAPMGLAAALAFAPTGASAGFLTYGDSQGVVNSYKECWQADTVRVVKAGQSKPLNGRRG
jgi:hypothetical protein